MNNQPLTGHTSNEMMELCLDGGQIGEDVCVIILKVSHYKGAWLVVHKL